MGTAVYSKLMIAMHLRTACLSSCMPQRMNCMTCAASEAAIRVRLSMHAMAPAAAEEAMPAAPKALKQQSGLIKPWRSHRVDAAMRAL